MVVLVDNGHGFNTSGKFSPRLDSSITIPNEFIVDGRFKEWKYNRVISNMLVDKLKSMGYDARLVVTEDKDISLSERVKRINAICNKLGASNVILISVHANAVGDGTKWMTGQGWEAYTTKGKTNSDFLAEYLYKRAEQHFKGRKIRKDTTDGDSDKEADFYIIRNAKCPAVLTENFFYDNKNDLAYMTSDEGVHAVVRTHIEGIIDYIQSKQKK